MNQPPWIWLLVIVLLILELGKLKRTIKWLLKGVKPNSSHETTSNETEESKGLSGMPEIENH